MEFMDTKLIIKRIKIRRTAIGMSQLDMAKALGVTQATYSRMESGHQIITFDQINVLLDAVNLKFSDIVKEEQGEIVLPKLGNSNMEEILVLIKDVLKLNNNELMQVFKTFITTSVEGNKELVSAVLKLTDGTFKFKSTKYLVTELEKLPNAEKIIHNMALVLQRNPEQFAKQFSFDVSSLGEQLSSEVQARVSDQKPHQSSKPQRTKRQP